ncbi:MAG: 4-hydroxy-tetrahydrodipicolinate synthase [Christensenellaceae bacterium]|jgi:4-hydroxy-tetrahydrodipicolinate synthase|nr:4-hydroxy-tetrahydrodipicolinate synthase [Christensenellaceae bacterium]
MVYTALITPFLNGKVDYKALHKLIQRQIDMKADGIVILGTTGEFSTLSDYERKKIIRFCVNNFDFYFIFGIGGNSPKHIIKLGQYIRRFGNYTVLISSPYYNKATQDGLFQYFKYVIDKIQLPVIVYNIPTRTGVNIDPQTMRQIAKLPYVAGIKEASGNIAQIQEICRTVSVPVFCGDDNLALPCYAVGCTGIISVASNINVENVKRIYQDRNLQLYQKELPFYKSLFQCVNPIPVKYQLSKMGLCQNELRLPLTPLVSEE